MTKTKCLWLRLLQQRERLLLRESIVLCGGFQYAFSKYFDSRASFEALVLFLGTTGL